MVILVSIIIPVYNKENLLEACLKSAQSQSYHNIEIIIVNDGSTDKSRHIIEDFILTESKSRLINQKNKGVAAARNNGIENAKGDYVYFLDADDIILESTIDTLVKRAEMAQSDMIVGNYYKQRESINEKNNRYDERIVSVDEFHSIQFQSEMFLFRERALASACNKLYKKEFLDSHNIRFNSEVFAEDRLFNLMCFVNVPEINLVDEYTYVYRLIEGTRSRQYVETHSDEIINIYNFMVETLENKSVINKHQNLLLINLLYDLDNLVRYQYRYNTGSYLNNFTTVLKSFRKNNSIKKVLREANINHIFREMKFGTLYKQRMKLFINLLKANKVRILSMLYILYLTMKE